MPQCVSSATSITASGVANKCTRHIKKSHVVHKRGSSTPWTHTKLPIAIDSAVAAVSKVTLGTQRTSAQVRQLDCNGSLSNAHLASFLAPSLHLQIVSKLLSSPCLHQRIHRCPSAGLEGQDAAMPTPSRPEAKRVSISLLHGLAQEARPAPQNQRKKHSYVALLPPFGHHLKDCLLLKAQLFRLEPKFRLFLMQSGIHAASRKRKILT